MRAGECQHLRPEDVDLDEGWIHVVSRPGAETKTGNSRKVPVHPRLRKVLEGLSGNRRTWFFTAQPSEKFPDGDHHINMKRMNEDFQQQLKKFGVAVGKKTNGFTLHSLRAFFKTFCIHSLVPREVVDKWMDHVGHRPVAGDGYYTLSDDVSKKFIETVPFGDG
jgi:integrase